MSMRSGNKFVSLLFALLFIATAPLSLHAADESYLKALSGKISKNDSCTVVDDKFINLPVEQWNQIRNISVENFVRFELRHDTSLFYYNRNFTCTLFFKVKYFTSRDQEDPTVVENLKLIVAYDTAKGASYKTLDQYNFQNAFKVTVVVDSIASPEWGNELPAVFRIQNQIQVKRKYPFQRDVNANLQAQQPGIAAGPDKEALRVSPDYNSGMNQMQISWQALDFPGYEEFDVEWTFVDQLSESGQEIENNPSAITETTLADWMRFDNTRITTTGFDYTINLPFNEGFLLARVRSVAYDPITGIRETSNWQYLRDAGDDLAFPAISFHEENLNWQYNATYAEEGKRKEVIGYFDGAMRSRQTVTINNEDNIAIAAETVYDNMGRPALQVLPAPVIDQATANDPVPRFAAKLQFYPNVNQNANGDPYSYADFLNPVACVTPAPAMNNANGAARYYSPQNPYLPDVVENSNYYFTKYLPDAAGYVFSQTIYMNDHTGRIRSQGGTGEAFRVGGGHESRYYYGKPMPTELYRLFGVEAGNASHYLKNMVVDPNGQVSVSYIDAKGRTVATALGGAPPTNVDALPSSESTSAKETVTQRLMGSADFQSDTRTLIKESTATFIASTPGSYSLQYTIAAEALGPWLAADYREFCSNCYYDILVTIKDDCGEIVASANTQPFLVDEVECDPEGNPVSQTINFTVAKLGEYTVSYKLRMSEDVIRDRTEYYIRYNTELTTLQDFFNSELLAAELEACFVECNSCMDKLSTPSYFSELMFDLLDKLKDEIVGDNIFLNVDDPAVYAWIETTYESLLEKCMDVQEECSSSPCDINLEMMKADVRPGGQYFIYDEATFTIPSSETALTIVNTKNGVTSNSYKTDAGITNFEFTDENGVVRHIKDTEVTLEMFIKAYQEHPEWADDFVKRHVEYCSYLWCVANSNAYIFEDKVRAADFHQANAVEYFGSIDPYYILDLDPFFNSGGTGVSYKAQMKNDMNNLSDVLRMTPPDANGNYLPTKSILDLVRWQLYCAPTDDFPSQQDLEDSWVCDINSIICYSGTGEWELYKMYYLKLRSKYLRLAKLAANPSCENCFIGDDNFSQFSCDPPGPLNNYALEATTEGIRVIYEVGNERFLSTYRIKVLNTVTNVVSSVIAQKGQTHSGPFPDLDAVLNGEILEVVCVNPNTPPSCSSGSPGGVPCYESSIYFSVFENLNCTPDSDAYLNWEECDALANYNPGPAPRDMLLQIRKKEVSWNELTGDVTTYTPFSVTLPQGQSVVNVGTAYRLTATPILFPPTAYLKERSFEVIGVECLPPPCPDNEDFSWDLAGNACEGIEDARSLRIYYNGGYQNLPFPSNVKITVSISVTIGGTTTNHTVVINNATGQGMVCVGSRGPALMSVNITSVACEAVTVPPVPASTCANDPRAPIYKGKLRRYNDYVDESGALNCLLGTIPVFTDQNDVDEYSEEQIDKMRAQAVLELADLKQEWLSRLRAVVAEENSIDAANGDPQRFSSLADLTGNIPNPTLVTLVNNLELVSKKYIEIAPAENIRPASTLPSPNVSSNGHATFKEIFDDLISSTLRGNGFTEHLLDYPYPYDKTPALASTPVIRITQDICDRLTAMKNRWVLAGSPATFHEYLKQELGDDYQLSANDLSMLEYACLNSCKILNAPILLPQVLAPDAPGDAANNRWVTCSEMTALKGAFDITYANVQPDTKLYRMLLQNFANAAFGFSLSFDDYSEFLTERCPVNSNVILYNKPGNPSIVPDYESICVENIMRTVFERALYSYHEYIEEEKRKFRHAYINKCLNAKASADLTGDLYEYHYTLYYYDQAGNLVKTIPPEGVALLTNDEVEKVTEAVAAGNDEMPTCDIPALPVTLDVEQALTTVSDVLEDNTLRAIEFWFGGNDEHYHQTRWVTPDQKYFVQAAIKDGKVWAQLYELATSGSGVGIVQSSQAVARLTQNASLDNWSHLVIQASASLLTSELQLYVNGELLTNLTGAEATGYPFDWNIDFSGGSAVLPANELSDLKHLRLYDRQVTGSEILADYKNACFSPEGDLATLIGSSGPLISWARFNIPPPGSPNTTSTRSAGSLELLSSAPALMIEYLLDDVYDNFTMEFWVKPDEEIVLKTPSLTIGSELAGRTGQKYAIYPATPAVLGSAGLGVSVGTNGVQVVENAGSYMPLTLSWAGTLNDWTHVAVVVTNRTPTLYINGVYAATGLQSEISKLHASTNLRGGMYGAMKGLIDDVRIWNVSRTATQVAETMNLLVESTTPNLALNWPLDPVAGVYAPDATGTFDAFLGASGWLWNTDAAPAYDPLVTEYQTPPFIVPDHRLPTHYAYNSNNQIIRQQSPDGGISQFWYDRLGRMVASQNEEQKNPIADDEANRYSYTKYDALGRVTEVGERYDHTPSSIPNGDLTEDIARTPASLETWYSNNINRQIIQTVYDIQPLWAPGSLNGQQRNLRKRVAAVRLLEDGTNSSAASYYNYDIIGNVSDLYQYNSAQHAAEADFITGATGLKHIKYEYDLLSGNVHRVRYQPGKWDQFGHAYTYDAENRLTDYYTTRHNFTSGPLVGEAHYRYYMHGPMARMELGNQRVQGLDYAYTLQGWLKGVNSQVLGAANDMSGDGLTASPFANVSRDVFGFSLGYYGRSGLGLKDYAAIGGGSAAAFGLVYDAPDETVPGTATGKSLFNGNISHATYAWSELNDGQTTAYSYRYDQLNRLTAMRQHNLGSSPGTWSNSSIIAAYSENISYDANGNILTYERKGANQPGMPLEMDKMSYVYNRDAGGRLIDNKLKQVKDAIDEANYSQISNGVEDIDNQKSDNYTYDRIGNVVADEDIEVIRWNVFGKIEKIEKRNGDDIIYKYDASGNRITKSVTVGEVTKNTFYIRDAQGNVMGIYSRNADVYRWDEQHLYASSRLGVVRPEIELQQSSPLANNNYNIGIETIADGVEGKRVYELGNHLSNVLSIISDRKIGVDDGGGPEIDYYIAEVLSQNDYYPFGMAMPGRQFEAERRYRYGFNGKELDKEMHSQTAYDYGFRIYNPALGRFLSVDPLARDYPSLSPYPFAMNRPIDGIDLDGAEWQWFLIPMLEKLVKRHIGLKPVNEKQLASERGYQAASTSYKAIKFMLEQKTPILNYWGKKFRSDQYYQMKDYLTSGMNEDVKSDQVKSQTEMFVNKWLHDFSYLATGTHSQSTLLNTIGDIFNLEDVSNNDKLDAIQGIIEQSRSEWRGISNAGLTFGNILLSYGGGTPNAKTLRVSIINTRVVSKGKDIALGVRENLGQFAKDVNGQTWQQWGAQDFQSQFLKVITNPNSKIHFNLDGIPNAWNAVRDGMKGFGHSEHVTSWELYEIYSRQDVLKRTIFYQGGKVVPSPF